MTTKAPTSPPQCSLCLGEGLIEVYDGEMKVSCWYCRGTGLEPKPTPSPPPPPKKYKCCTHCGKYL